MVAVADEHVAAVRAMLVRDFDEHDRLMERIEASGSGLGFSAMVAAAFVQAVRRRFGTERLVPDIIRYVVEVRTRYEDPASIDPRAAERLIRAALGDASAIEGMDEEAKTIQLLLLCELIADERLGDAQLDETLNAVRANADEILAGLEIRAGQRSES